MIISCSLFHKEFEMLVLKAELMRHPDVLQVVIESPWTFSGKPKKLYFQENQEDFRKYPIAHFVVDQMPNNGNPWDNEKASRNYITQAVAKLMPLYPIDDDTKIIIADCDEVTDVSKIIDWKGEIAALKMNKYGFYLNVMEQEQGWNIAKICTWRHLKSKSAEEIRNAGFPEEIPHAGYHWSYLGGLDAIMDKAAAFSHQEAGVQRHFTRENIEHKLKTIESLWGTDHWSVIPLDTLPKYIQEHAEELDHLIYKSNV